MRKHILRDRIAGENGKGLKNGQLGVVEGIFKKPQLKKGRRNGRVKSNTLSLSFKNSVNYIIMKNECYESPLMKVVK